jgi:hypothetical protein
MVFFVSGALAVHDTGLFQLDGNAVTVNPPPGDDWDRVCHQANPAACPSGTNTSAQGGAIAVDWNTDNLLSTGLPSLTATTFTGGGSKDPQDISNWAWKDGGGGLPSKDNLLHEFAARYSVPSNPNCPAKNPNGTTNTNGTLSCDVLYFGSDRYDNSGDAQQGFWFFQNKIGLGTNSVGGGSGFTGVHKNGDLLLVSDFSNGGATSTITVYRWDTSCSKAGATASDGTPCGDANLATLATSTTANCATAGPGDAFCGIVNSATITMPWSFTDKSGTPNNQALNGEFYEGGINLSAFNLQNECFSSVASESRSSTSTTSTLQDFILGGFAACGATFATTPSGDTTLSGVGGSATVSDMAKITVSGLQNPPAPDTSTSVKFYLCGPSSTQLTSCSNTGTGAGTLKSTVSMAGAVKNGNMYTVSSDDTADGGTAVSVTQSGYYCWFATWPGDTNYTNGPYTDGGSTECFKVTQPTSVSTTLHETNSSGTDVNPPVNGNNGTTITINNGGYVTDYATVTPHSASGTVTFRYYSGATAQTDCTNATGGTDGTGTGGTTAGTGVTPDSTTGIAKSTPTPFNTPGIYYWRAFFVHSGAISLDSSSDCSEILTVNQPTQVSTKLHETDSSGNDVVTNPPGGNNGTTITINNGGYVTDYATVTPVTGTTPIPTGSVTFRYYGGANGQSNCTNATGGTDGTGTGGTTAGTGISVDSTTGVAKSTPTQFNTPGTYYWRAFFVGSGRSLNSSSDCSEVLTVNQPTQVSTELHQTNSLGVDDASGNIGTAITVFPGTYVTDHATVSPVVGTTPIPTGNVAFKVYSGSTAQTDCNADTNGTSTAGTPEGGGAVNSTTGIALSNAVQFSTPGVYYWRAFFTGSGFSLNSASDCSEKVTVNQLQPTMDTRQFFYPNDSAEIQVATGAGALAGNVRFQLFDNADCSDAANHRLYDSGNIDITSGAGTADDMTVSTNNTTVKVDANSPSLNLSWLVTYTTTNTGHKNVTSTCHNENSSVTINNGSQSSS